jgi:peptide/nickel transport system permease protein
MNTSALRRVVKHTGVRVSAAILIFLMLLGALAPWIANVPSDAMDAMHVNSAVGSMGQMALPDGQVVTMRFWMGTDGLGRDIFSRVVYGAQVTLIVGFCTAVIATAFGMFLGLLSGYFRLADALIMRVMDGLMAIPSILLAIALVATLGAKLWIVVLAIAVPEIPRVTRLIRSLVLSLKEEPFVEAARALATPTGRILIRHILPNALAPMLVQGTFIAASAILTESALSFLGLGLPPHIPTWGNVMAEGRISFSSHPSHVLFPAMLLVPTVLAITHKSEI